jgi:hypothetical protein
LKESFSTKPIKYVQDELERRKNGNSADYKQETPPITALRALRQPYSLARFAVLVLSDARAVEDPCDWFLVADNPDCVSSFQAALIGLDRPI